MKVRRRAVDGGRKRMKVEGASWRKVQGWRDGGGVEGVGIRRMMEITDNKTPQLKPSTWSNEYCKAKTRSFELLSSQHIGG